MNNTNATLFVCGILCVYPLVSAAIGIVLYRRYIEGGWRSVFFGKQVIK